MKEIVRAVKEFFCGKPADIRVAYVKPTLEKPVQPTEEVLKLKEDYDRNPEAWTFGDTHFGNDHILQRGDHISIYYSEPHHGNKTEDLYVSLMRPLNCKVENVADKEIIRTIYSGMGEREEAAKRKLLSNAVDALFTKTKRRLLIDMDGVLMDYYGAFVIEWKKRYPDRAVLPASMIKTFYLEEMYLPEYKKDILAITQGKDFFENMPSIAGAVEFMEEVWNSDEYDPFICTAPDMDSEGLMCATEKLRSIERLFGKKWLKKTIMTNDKTLIDGYILIDDKPEIKGVATPRWKRVFYTHRYNSDLKGPRINKWSEWKDVLANVEV